MLPAPLRLSLACPFLTQHIKRRTLFFVPCEFSGNIMMVCFWHVQTRRAERRFELTDRQQPPTPRQTQPATPSSTQQHSRLQWVCHQSGTDRVYINHREHYVWQTSWTQSTNHLAVTLPEQRRTNDSVNHQSRGGRKWQHEGRTATLAVFRLYQYIYTT